MGPKITFKAILLIALTVGQAPALVGPPSPAVAQVQQFSQGLAEIAAAVKPSVVAIAVSGKVAQQQNPFDGTPWERFFRMPDQGERRRGGEGSGVVVKYESQYYILTNNHVIQGADEIEITTADDRTFPAQTVGTDQRSDLALLKVDVDELPAVELGDSDNLHEGEMVLAIGNPFGFEHTITSGIISAINRDRFGDEYGSFIQTDAAVNPGNSGGALVNMHGQLVGINTAIVANGTRGYQGLSFAIPVNLAKNVLSQLVEFGEVRRGLLGVIIGGIDPDMAAYLKLGDRQGVLIREVQPDKAAARAGVKELDVVLSVDGQPTKTVTQLRNTIGATRPGTEVKLRLWRDGKEKNIGVTLGQLDSKQVAANEAESEAAEDDLGLMVQDLEPRLAQRLGLDADETGVLVRSVKPGSKAARKIQRGDLIKEVNEQPVRSVSDYQKALKKVSGENMVLLLVRRGELTSYIALPKS